MRHPFQRCVKLVLVVLLKVVVMVVMVTVIMVMVVVTLINNGSGDWFNALMVVMVVIGVMMEVVVWSNYKRKVMIFLQITVSIPR